MNDEVNKIEEIILEPDPARVMEGLRDTGYDFNTAMADIVDNSIAADATIIKVKVDLNPSGNINIYVADNGCGMDFEGLKNAMRYGSTERVDPSSLGKFGLGLKTASTAFCRSLSLLSKDKKDADYHKVQWDLDEICKINKWQLLQPPIEQDEIDLLEETTHGESGTLVIWHKVDNIICPLFVDCNHMICIESCRSEKMKMNYSVESSFSHLGERELTKEDKSIIEFIKMIVSDYEKDDSISASEIVDVLKEIINYDF